MQSENYRTKDMWVAMCLVTLGEELVKVDYDSISGRVFFEFNTPIAKGKAIEAVFASQDRRLSLPVVDLQRAYEHLHRYRYLIMQIRRPLELKEVKRNLEDILSQTETVAPADIDEAINLLKGGEHNE